MSDKILIITTADNNYVENLAAFVFSLFKNKNVDTQVYLTIIDGGLTDLNKNKILQIAKDKVPEIRFVTIDKNLYKGFYISNHINETTYYRFSIPNLYDESVKKVLYLDCDTIILKDLSGLWQTDISEYYLAASKDWGISSSPPRPYSYFNAGVLLLNLEMIRRDNIMNKAFQYTIQNRPRLYDQDSLNAIVGDEYLQLSPNFNAMTCLYYPASEKKELLNIYNDVTNLDPVIVHFSGQDKLLFLFDNNPYKTLFYRYLIQTPWKWSIFRYLLKVPRHKLSYTYLKYEFLGRHKRLHNLLKKVKHVVLK